MSRFFLTVFSCAVLGPIVAASSVVQAEQFEYFGYVPRVNQFGGTEGNREWQPTFNFGHELPPGDISSLSVRLDSKYGIRMTNLDGGGPAEKVGISIGHTGLGRNDASNSYKMKLLFADESDFEFAGGVEGPGVGVSLFHDFIPTGTYKDLIGFELLVETLDNPAWQIGAARFEFRANTVETVCFSSVPEPSCVLAISFFAIGFVLGRKRAPN